MAVSLLLAACVLQPGAVTLKLSPEAGLARTYRQETAFSIQKVKFTYRSVYQEEHLGASPEGPFSFKLVLKEGTLIVPGSKIPLPASDRVLRMSPTGMPLRSEGETSEELRLRRLTSIPLPAGPVKVGDSWEFRFPADTPEVPEIRGKVQLLALEPLLGLEAAKISLTCKEYSYGEASGTTSGWVDRASGLPIKARSDLKKAPFAKSITDGSWSMALVVAAPSAKPI